MKRKKLPHQLIRDYRWLATKALVIAAYRWLNKPRTIRIKKTKIIIGLYLAYLLYRLVAPSPPHTIYAEPSQAPITPVYKVALAKTLPVPNVEPLQGLQTVYIAPPPPPAPKAAVAPPVASSGCTTWFSGDYYLDKIIRYESGGNSCATNYLGCFGLLQACPGEPLRAACGGSPACQIAWFQANKTGGRSWATIWQHELDFGWW